MTKTERIPSILYHGSGFSHRVLKPGFIRSGELVEWDETESNEFLYATRDKRLAIDMAIASAIEKKFILNHFHSDEKNIEITLDVKSPIMTKVMLSTIKVYIYTIMTDNSQGWVKVDNQVNNAKDEWKTKKFITRFSSIEVLYGINWMKNKNVKIIHPRA